MSVPQIWPHAGVSESASCIADRRCCKTGFTPISGSTGPVSVPGDLGAEGLHPIEALLAAEKVGFKDFEEAEIRYFEGCLPIEVMAERGRDTLRYGPMKPVGLIDPRNGAIDAKVHGALACSARSGDIEVLFEGALELLRHFQDDVSEVREGQECGIRLVSFQQLSDFLICPEIELAFLTLTVSILSRVKSTP